MKLTRGGFAVPCRIIHGNEGWSAEINGKAFPPCPDPALSPEIYRIWLSASHSNVEAYSYLVALKEWAATHQPSHPLLHPYQPVDIAALAPVVP